MELHSFANVRPHKDPLRSGIGRLIEVVGTPRFEPEMFQATRSAIGCEHLTAFAFADETPPRVLIASNAGSLPVAKSLARKYVNRYWKLDPANKAGKFEKNTSNIALRILPNDIDDGTYRHECYTAVRLQDRFTVMQRCGTEIFRINFYRGARGGRFSDIDVDRMMNSADLLTSLLVKHDASTRQPHETVAPGLFQNRLRLLEPGMPQRENEVCAAIMLGMTSEAIALKLGISINTVLTYRKRAYRRLGISCQNELLRLILS